MGYVGDKYGFIMSLNNLHAILFIFILTLQFISFSKTLYLIWVAAFFFILGGRSPLLPSYAFQIFGSKKAPNIFPYMNIGSFLGNCLQFILVASLSLKFGYHLVLWILSLASMLAIICTSTLLRRTSSQVRSKLSSASPKESNT